MIGKRIFVYVFLVLPILAIPIYSQTKDSIQNADEFLEDYTVPFQEHFFEALKQKGLQNYDRAIAAFLECQKLDPNLSELDYEIGKSYMHLRKFPLAENYLIKAILTEPENYWYVESLVDTYHLQGRPIGIVDTHIPLQNNILRFNLASVLYKKRQWKQAENYLKELPNTNETNLLQQKITEAIAYNNRMQNIRSKSKIQEKAISAVSENPMQQLKERMRELERQKSFKLLFKESMGALDLYPAQPFFYYMQGLAANRLGKYPESITVLEMGMDFLIDDKELKNNILRELVIAYNAIGKTRKAKEIETKIKL